jgi:hypothetical protein
MPPAACPLLAAETWADRSRQRTSPALTSLPLSWPQAPARWSSAPQSLPSLLRACSWLRWSCTTAPARSYPGAPAAQPRRRRTAAARPLALRASPLRYQAATLLTCPPACLPNTHTRRASLEVRASSVLDYDGLYWPPSLCADGDATTYCSTFSSHLERDHNPNITVRYPCHTGGSSSLSRVVVVPRREENLLVYAALDFRNASGALDGPSFSFAKSQSTYAIPVVAATVSGPAVDGPAAAGPATQPAPLAPENSGGGGAPAAGGRMLDPIIAVSAAVVVVIVCAACLVTVWRRRKQREPDGKVSCPCPAAAG